jgi:hypothetical protein
MKRERLGDLTVAQLVERYVEAGIGEDKAEMQDDLPRRNRLCRQMFAIADELKSRSGDQRRALLPLYTHQNMEVRLMAAKATLAIAPIEARKIIESIAASNWFPYAGDAGMCLEMLDQGIFVPD